MIIHVCLLSCRYLWSVSLPRGAVICDEAFSGPTHLILGKLQADLTLCFVHIIILFVLSHAGSVRRYIHVIHSINNENMSGPILLITGMC